MKNNNDNEQRLKLLLFLEESRRRQQRPDDITGAIPKQIIITLADLLYAHFIDIGQCQNTIIEQFEDEELIAITQRPLRPLSWRPTMFDRVDSENAYIVEILPKFHDILNSEIYGKKIKNNHENQALAKGQTLINTGNKPHVVEKDGIGYLQLEKDRTPIKIGRVTSQPYLLLRSLTEPFGNPKSTGVVFEAMRTERHSNKTGITTQQLDRNGKIKLIQYSGIKHLQKIKELHGKLKYCWDELNTKIWLEYLG